MLKRSLQQLAFIEELDQLKSVLRKTSPISQNRKENSAEHSWQVVLSALILAEHSNEEIDVLKVVKMLVIHDTVEIDVGDTFHYLKTEDPDLYQKELAAAKRVFGLLPKDQNEEFLDLWKEFEARQTPEAKFANAVDRLMAFILNRGNGGGTMLEYSITWDMIVAKNGHAKEGSEEIWKIIEALAKEVLEK